MAGAGLGGWRRALLFSLAYFAAIELGKFLSVQPSDFATFWPASGLFIAALLLVDTAGWPLLLLAALPANLASDLLHGRVLEVGLPLFAGNVLEAMVGAGLVRRFIAARPDMSSLRHVFGLIGLAGLGTVISATVGAGVIHLFFGAAFTPTWLTWWTANILGLLTVAPFLLVWLPPPLPGREPAWGWLPGPPFGRTGPPFGRTGPPFGRTGPPFGRTGPPTGRRLAELALLLLCLGLSVWLVFISTAQPLLLRPYLLLPPLIWMALRFSGRGVTLLNLGLALVGVWCTLQGYGKFAVPGQPVSEQILALQGFLAITSTMTLTLLAVLMERRRTEAALRRSEQQYRTLFDNATDAILIYDLAGRLLEVNQVAAETLGYSPAELRELTLFDISPPEAAGAIRERLSAVRQRGLFQAEALYTRRDRTCIPVELNNRLIEYAGQPAVLSTARDISERRRAADALRASEARYRLFIRNFHGIAYQALHPGFQPLFFHGAVEAITGYTAAEFMEGRVTWGELIYPDDRPRVLAEANKIAARGDYVGQLEYCLRRKDGRICWVYDVGQRVQAYLDGAAVIQGAVYDVTGRKQAEADIERRNRDLALLNRIIAVSAASSEIEPILDTLCRELAQALNAHHAVAALLGDDGATGRVAAEYRADGQGVLLNVTFQVAESVVFEFLLAQRTLFAAPDAAADPHLAPLHAMLGQWNVAGLLAIPLLIEDEVVGTLVLGSAQPRHFTPAELDLAQSVAGQVVGALARARLSQVQQRLSAAIEQAGEVIVMTDPAGTIVYVNPAFERLTGYSQAEAVGQNPRLLKSGQQDAIFYQAMWATIKAGQVWQGRLVNRKKDGSLYSEDTTITPVLDKSGAISHYVAVKRDVTDLLRLEEQFRQAQKMEAVGRLAGGVAHDFNNLLTVINGLVSFLLHNHPDPADPDRNDLEQIMRAGERASSLTRQLLAFSRKQVLRPELVDVNLLIREMQRMLGRLIGETIEVTLQLQPDLGRVLADPGQLEQVLLNLALNARDAMPAGGRLSLTTANVTLDASYGQRYLDVTPGDYVLIAVSDTGVGMDKNVLAHLFEPFFTTKPVGKGTGLGLATVHGIIKQSGGHITAYSEPGHGSVFKVYLPRLREERRPDEARGLLVDLPGGQETVLVVEDDPRVRRLVIRLLSDQGYNALEAANGAEALQIGAAPETGPIHLLVTDVILPGINGRDLASQFQQLHPETALLFMSGYLDDTLAPFGILGAGRVFIHKPFTAEALIRTVREVLDRAISGQR